MWHENENLGFLEKHLRTTSGLVMVMLVLATQAHKVILGAPKSLESHHSLRRPSASTSSAHAAKRLAGALHPVNNELSGPECVWEMSGSASRTGRSPDCPWAHRAGNPASQAAGFAAFLEKAQRLFRESGKALRAASFGKRRGPDCFKSLPQTVSRAFRGTCLHAF